MIIKASSPVVTTLRLLVLASSCSLTSSFVSPLANTVSTTTTTTTTSLKGYLDDLSKELYSQVDEPDLDKTYEATKARLEDTDRFGVGTWDGFVDFEEFDGGDGQMGVAGDGKKGLEKEWKGAAQMAKSKVMSAKNAWGKVTGYAEELIDQGMEATRAQQLENWQNQQEVLQQRRQQKWMTDEFDKVSGDENWRSLSNFGIERNQNFDLNQAFGEVKPGDKLEGVVELSSRINQPKIYEFKHRNSFMGFSDFRAAITPDTGDWTITPTEGSLNGRKDTDFLLKYRPGSPGVREAYLVIDTEDDKWTWKLIGSASM